MKEVYAVLRVQTRLEKLRPVLWFLMLSVLSVCAKAQSPTAPALGFNVFLQKGANLINNETEGPVAIGGDLTLSQNSYQVSTNYTGTFKVNNVPVTLVIGGKVNYNGGNGISVNQNGYVKIGSANGSKVWYTDNNNAYPPIRITPGSDYNGSPRINLQANAQQLGVSAGNNPVFQSGVIDFDGAFAKLKSSSSGISACADNAVLTDPNGNVLSSHTGLPNQVKINLHTGTNTLNLNGSDMNNVQVFTYNNKPDASHVLVINVNAAGTFNWNVWNSGGVGFQDCPYILYNFYNTTTLNIQGNGAVEGTVFAPFADITKTANQSNIEGQIVAQSYLQNGGENHYAVFDPNISGCGVVCNLGVSGVKTDITCNGAANGAINITASGANGAMSYLWNDNVTTEDRSNLAAGNYSVQVSDAGGCKASSNVFTISEPSAIAVNGTIINATTVGGKNGSIDITVSGGMAGYTYKWNDGITTEDRTGLAAGNYSVTVTDKNGCSSAKSFVVSEPVCNLAISGTKTDITCHGSANGAINITASSSNGAISYLWNDNITTKDRTGLSAGSYSVQATDAAGCKAASNAFIITEPIAIAVSGTAVNVTAVGGKDGSIDITVSGGTPAYTYKWNDSITTEDRTGLAAGSYTVTVTDKNGCSNSAPFTITEPSCHLSATAAKTNVSCNSSANGSINVTPTGNNGTMTYMWNDGAVTEDRAGLKPGNYCVQITDAAGCKFTTPMYVISEPTAISITGTVTNVTTVSGKNGAIDITVSGGTSPYTYKWNDGVTTEDRKGLKAGTYTVTVTDKNGCSNSKSFVVSGPVCNIKLTGTIKPVCCYGGNDGAIDLTVSGNTGSVVYAWNDGAATEDRTNLTAGTYSVKVTDSIGCAASCSNMAVKQPQPLQVTAKVTGQTSTQVCNGTAKLSATGGTAPYTFTWEDGYVGASRSNLCMGAYQVTIKDSKGCTCTYTVKVPCPGESAKTGITAIASTTMAINTDVALSPNPTTGLIRININATSAGNATIAVYDLTGKALIRNQVNLVAGANQQQVDVSALAKGLYQVQIATDNGSKIFKVILK